MAVEPDASTGRRRFAAPSARAKRWERAWLGAILFWTVFRLVVAWGTLTKYGVNVWVFGFLDVVTSWPYAVATARMVPAIINGRHRETLWWVFIAIVSFVAPYAYVVIVARDMSGLAWEIFGGIVLVLAVAGVLSVWRGVRRARRPADPAASAAS